ncbi:NADPH dehydrogenase [Paenibacillus sp. CECT 9249]|uniref:NADPH dehydrogenase NamA n=1 Tax=Paenibacillus sp. CECT 9249 TaxID=2845385 RepID=UPI001E6394C0|nr:NADPH dehydrogenase NamA [Paenibacillus sp. CECT 9249]CAH0119251.1 NADPH dehydrogenase [Paenibacillus sp. CECT 9249]
MSQLFSPITVNGLALKNRIVMSPMCMYSCDARDGKVTNFHKTHYTSRAVGQVGLIVVEATAVTPQGRISDRDLGIWSDEHIAGLKELVNLAHEAGAAIGIQLAHAGRKAELEGPIVAPSALPFNERYKTPEEMTQGQIRETIEAFKQGASRAKQAGFDVIEIHAAHGYLINEFLSPLTNRRSDEYGGTPEGRYRFLSEIVEAVKEVWSGPLFVRISASDYHPEGLTVDDYVGYARTLKSQGIDLIDCSSGAVVPAHIDAFPGYQVPFAERIKREAELMTGAVGLITTGTQAEEIIRGGQADLIFIARALLRDPYWPRTAAKELGATIPAPPQYGRGWNM